VTADDVIAQLKAYAPIFNGNVAGAAEWELANDQVWMPQPAAYVVQVDDEAEPNGNLTGLYQTVRRTIGIVVDLNNSADRRGQAASTDAVSEVRVAIFKAVLWWRPASENAANGFYYARGGYLRSNRARLIWQFDFTIETTLTSDDGFQPPSQPLTDILGTVTDQATGLPITTFDAALPQS